MFHGKIKNDHIGQTVKPSWGRTLHLRGTDITIDFNLHLFSFNTFVSLYYASKYHSIPVLFQNQVDIYIYTEMA